MEDTNLHSYHFDEQYNTYMQHGYAVAPNGDAMVGNVHGMRREKENGVHCGIVGEVDMWLCVRGDGCMVGA